MPNALTPYVNLPYRQEALTPEVVDPRLADVEALARVLDYAFELPGGFRFGIAGFIGLIPGIGDVINALISSFIIFRAIQLGVPRVAVARMFVNVGIEAVAGSVPIIGDLFDIAFKANRRNYLILKSRVTQPQQHRKSDWLFMVAAVLVALVCMSLPVIVLIALSKHL